MKSTGWSVALAAAMSLVYCSAGSAAEPTSQVVRVEGCAADGARPGVTFPSLSGQMVEQPAVPAMLMIDYANTSMNPISVIDFGLVKDGKLITMVRDTGRFAPRAQVMHAFVISENAVPQDPMSVSCIPLRIQYANGTSWMNQDVNAR
jgi:hypothetical protein